MVGNLKALLILLALCIIREGVGAPCGLSNIVVTQGKTGRIVEGQPEYEVLVSNNCQCPQSKVFVQCYSLSSVEEVEAHAIRAVDDEKCIVGDGRPLAHGAPIRFKYAWLTPQDFPVVSSHIYC